MPFGHQEQIDTFYTVDIRKDRSRLSWTTTSQGKYTRIYNSQDLGDLSLGLLATQGKYTSRVHLGIPFLTKMKSDIDSLSHLPNNGE